MANYEHIVQEHMKLHESLFNKQADIIKEVSELRDMAEELNQENLLLKKYSMMCYLWLNIQSFVVD